MFEVQAVSHAYPHAAGNALRDLSLRVGPGETLGLLGEAGAGKTTLLKILAGIIRDYRGRVAFEGKDLLAWSRDFFEHIGTAFGNSGNGGHFGSLDALGNLVYFGSLYRGAGGDASKAQKALKALEEMGLGREAKHRVALLTPGMRTRLSWARALLHKPKAILIDLPSSAGQSPTNPSSAGQSPTNPSSAGQSPTRPASHSDAQAEEILLPALEARRREGATIILATTDAALAEKACDRIAWLVAGRLEALDTPAGFRKRFGRPTLHAALARAAGGPGA